MQERKVIRLRKSLSSANVVANLQEEETRVRREEVDFIERIISVYLGVYVCSPEILRCDYSDIARLSDKIRSSRPGEYFFFFLEGILFLLKIIGEDFLRERVRYKSDK